MVIKPRKIVWDNSAKLYLKQSLAYIRVDSPQNADTIRNDIRTIVKGIPSHPTRYPADKYRTDNHGDYRALTIYNFRISYFIGDEEIRIVRVRHNKQSPLVY